MCSPFVVAEIKELPREIGVQLCGIVKEESQAVKLLALAAWPWHSNRSMTSLC